MYYVIAYLLIVFTSIGVTAIMRRGQTVAVLLAVGLVIVPAVVLWVWFMWILLTLPAGV